MTGAYTLFLGVGTAIVMAIGLTVLLAIISRGDRA